jgi:hypothetical protein
MLPKMRMYMLVRKNGNMTTSPFLEREVVVVLNDYFRLSRRLIV